MRSTVWLNAWHVYRWRKVRDYSNSPNGINLEYLASYSVFWANDEQKIKLHADNRWLVLAEHILYNLWLFKLFIPFYKQTKVSFEDIQKHNNHYFLYIYKYLKSNANICLLQIKYINFSGRGWGWGYGWAGFIDRSMSPYHMYLLSSKPILCLTSRGDC